MEPARRSRSRAHQIARSAPDPMGPPGSPWGPPGGTPGSPAWAPGRIGPSSLSLELTQSTGGDECQFAIEFGREKQGEVLIGDLIHASVVVAGAVSKEGC